MWPFNHIKRIMVRINAFFQLLKTFLKTRTNFWKSWISIEWARWSYIVSKGCLLAESYRIFKRLSDCVWFGKQWSKPHAALQYHSRLAVSMKFSFEYWKRKKTRAYIGDRQFAIATLFRMTWNSRLSWIKRKQASSKLVKFKSACCSLTGCFSCFYWVSAMIFIKFPT